MNMLRELSLFIRLFAGLALGLLVAAFMLFQVHVGGETFVVFVFEQMKGDLVPASAMLVSGSPLAVFGAEMLLATFLAALFVAPFALLALYAYLAPALTPREKRFFFGSLVLALLLFLFGAYLGYRFVIPRMFSLMTAYAVALGIPQYFFIGEFLSTVLVLLAVCGAVFLLPLLMPLLTRLGVIPAQFWRDQWRIFIVLSLVVTAILTNDGMGVTMLMLTAPLAGCYGLGTGLAAGVERLEKKGN